MRAAILRAPGTWSIEELPTPEPKDQEVLVEVAACGVCGTDLHTLEGRNPLVRYPVTPGHEIVGTVTALGAGAGARLRVGDRVAIDPSRSCGACWHCRSGWPNLCPDKGGHGSRVPGGFAEYVVAREESCVRFAPTMSWDRAMLAEPLACVLHGMDRLGTVLGKRTLVFGAGTIGLLAAELLRTAGAEVQLVEPSPARRQLAGSWGLRCAASPAEADPPEGGWDVVVDATGVPAAIEDAFTLVRRAGTILLLGVAPADARVSVSPFSINWMELTVIGSMAVRHSFQRAVELLPALEFPLESLVTHHVALDELEQAIGLLRNGEGLKVAVSARDRTH